MYFRLFYFKYDMQFICSMVDKSFVELHLVIMYAFWLKRTCIVLINLVKIICYNKQNKVENILYFWDAPFS